MKATRKDISFTCLKNIHTRATKLLTGFRDLRNEEILKELDRLHVRNRVCPRVEFILKIIIIFLGFIKSKP